jgi:hypothetical protein
LTKLPEDSQRIFRLMLDENQICVAAAVKVFFDQLAKGCVKGEEGGTHFNGSFWKAKQAGILPEILYDFSNGIGWARRKQIAFDSSVEDWVDQLKADLGLGSSPLVKQISRRTTEAVNKVKGIFKMKIGPNYVFPHETSGLIDELGQKYREDATIEIIGNALGDMIRVGTPRSFGMAILRLLMKVSAIGLSGLTIRVQR